MEFRTVLHPIPSSATISLNDTLFTIGSCFADNIGLQLKKNKINTLVNPFGTIYNPVSIHKLLSYAAENARPDESTYASQGEVFFNYDFHTSFSDINKAILEAKISEWITKAHEILKQSKFLFITYGTSFVYERKENSEIVSNCHKVPAGHFNKELLTQKKILESFQFIHSQLGSLNKDLRIILTVSPVRHIKDTLELNAVSKSILRLSCHTLTTQYNNVDYFPAYEILLDDLRDYRFYEPDLIHPSRAALDYIWDKFCSSYLTNEARHFISHWQEIAKALSHRPFNPTSAAHQKFLKLTLRQLDELKNLIDVSEEMEWVKNQIIS
jgi:hypothetical protein